MKISRILTKAFLVSFISVGVFALPVISQAACPYLTDRGNPINIATNAQYRDASGTLHPMSGIIINLVSDVTPPNGGSGTYNTTGSTTSTGSYSGNAADYSSYCNAWSSIPVGSMQGGCQLNSFHFQVDPRNAAGYNPAGHWETSVITGDYAPGNITPGNPTVSFNIANGVTWTWTLIWSNTRPPVGNLDSASCDANGNLTVIGWTCDPDNYSQPNRVRLHYDIGSGPFPADDNNLPNTISFSPSDDSIYPNLIMPNVYRQDITNVCAGYLYHGFNKTIPAPSAIKDGNPHNIAAFGLDWFPWSVNGSGFIQHTFLGNKEVSCPTQNISPPSCSLTPLTQTVKQGDPVTLQWNDSGNAPISLNQSNSVPPISLSGTRGSIQVLPSITTTYTLKDSSGNVCPATATITVNPDKSGSSQPVPPH